MVGLNQKCVSPSITCHASLGILTCLSQACDDGGDFILSKTDEPFGEIISEVLSGAVKRKLSNSGSRCVDRIDEAWNGATVEG